MSRDERKAMIVPDRPGLSLSRQCRLLSISRSSFYYAPRGESPENLVLMRRIDEMFLRYPFFGSRRMVRQLRRDGVRAGRHRVRRLMRLMGLEAIYQAPKTSTPHPAHRIYPYLLRNMAVERPDHVWCADITYIPVRRGFLYLVAIMDWATRHVLAWEVYRSDESVMIVRKPERRFGKLQSNFTLLEGGVTASLRGVKEVATGLGAEIARGYIPYNRYQLRAAKRIGFRQARWGKHCLVFERKLP